MGCVLCIGVGGCSVIHWNRLRVGCCSQSASFPERPPAMVDATLPLPGLSPIGGKDIVARFDGGLLSSDGGLVVLREIERRLSVADRLAACIDDPRDPASTVHTLADIIRFRLLMIAAGYEDANDDRPAPRSAVQDGARTCRRSATCVRSQ